jgi:hypothetical protein
MINFKQYLNESPLNAWQNRMKRKGATKFVKKDSIKHQATDDLIHAVDETGKYYGAYSQSMRQEVKK